MEGRAAAPTLRFDHAVVAVRSLSEAVARYRRLGFTVASGGRHAGSPTHNALIPFRDGSYLELLATTRPLLPPLLRTLRRTPLLRPVLSGYPPLARRFLRHFATRLGLVDFALETSSLDTMVAAARARGIAIAGPYAMGRTRPDGARLEWKLGVPHDAELPFLIEDVTPRELRVPAGAAAAHPLGVTGVSGLLVAAPELEASLGRYRALLGIEPAAGAERSATFLVGATRIQLLARGAARHARGPTALVLATR